MDYLDKEEFMGWLEGLSKIRLSEEERLQVKEDMFKTIGLFQVIDEAFIEEDDVLQEPSVFSAMRQDIVTNTGETGWGIDNAPQMKDGYYVVPAAR